MPVKLDFEQRQELENILAIACLMVEPKNDEFVLRIKEPFPDVWPSGLVKDNRITYGPQRKGKGGKAKRW